MLPNNVPPADAEDASGFYIDYRPDGAHLILTGNYCENISKVGAKNLAS